MTKEDELIESFIEKIKVIDRYVPGMKLTRDFNIINKYIIKLKKIIEL